MKKDDNNGRFLFDLLSVLLLLFLAGCWDQRDIEELSFKVGEALDMGEPTQLEQEFEKEDGKYKKRNLVTFTLQNVVPQATGKGQQEIGGGQQKAYENISVTGDSIYQLLKETALLDEHLPHGSHLKVVIIGEELARNLNLSNLINEYFRSLDVRESVNLFVAKGRAKDTLETKKAGEIPSFRLIELVENRLITTRILPPVTLTKLLAQLAGDSSFLLQTVVAKEGEVKLVGAAVINGKTKKLLGYLDEEDLEGIIWIAGEGKGGVVKSFYKDTDQLVVYKIDSMKSKIKAYVNEEDTISFDVKIQSEGTLIEDWVGPGNAFDNEFLKEAEKAIKKEVERLVRNVLEKMQDEYKVDVAGFGKRLRIQHPRVWEDIKEDWDKTFSDVAINYDIDITITDYSMLGSKK
jgi:spore germination protein